VMFTSQSAL